jgi:hypothetical protein
MRDLAKDLRSQEPGPAVTARAALRLVAHLRSSAHHPDCGKEMCDACYIIMEFAAPNATLNDWLDVFRTLTATEERE